VAFELTDMGMYIVMVARGADDRCIDYGQSSLCQGCPRHHSIELPIRLDQ
jgi:hypothetical protein